VNIKLTHNYSFKKSIIIWGVLILISQNLIIFTRTFLFYNSQKYLWSPLSKFEYNVEPLTDFLSIAPILYLFLLLFLLSRKKIKKTLSAKIFVGIFSFFMLMNIFEIYATKLIDYYPSENILIQVIIEVLQFDRCFKFYPMRFLFLMLWLIFARIEPNICNIERNIQKMEIQYFLILFFWLITFYFIFENYFVYSEVIYLYLLFSFILLIVCQILTISETVQMC